MGLDIHGWIEITYASDGEAQDDTMWMGVTRLAPLVDVPDKFSEAVFGWLTITRGAAATRHHAAHGSSTSSSSSDAPRVMLRYPAWSTTSGLP